jgi:hypothetical protein
LAGGGVKERMLAEAEVIKVAAQVRYARLDI